MTRGKYILALIGIGYLTFFNSLFNGFVYDDAFQIITNSFVHNGDFFYYFTHTTGANPHYRPLMFLIFTSFFQLVGLNAFFFHLFQITFHIINGLIVFWLFQRISKQMLLSFCLALIFVIHPLTVEPVVYISNLQDILFVTFGLGALYIGITKCFRYWLILAGFLLFLSLLAKETGLLFGMVYSIYILFFDRGVGNRIRSFIVIASSISAYVILRIVALGSHAIEITTYGTVVPNTILVASLFERFLTIPKIISFYLMNFIFPLTLAEQYWYVKVPTFSDFFLPLIFILIFFGAIFLYGSKLAKINKHRSKYFLFFIVWFAFGLFFHLNVIPLDKTVTPRWFYFPMIGLLGMILISIQSVKLKKNGLKQIALFGFIIIVILLSLRTIVRNANWYNNLTLFSHDISSVQNSPNMHYNYGTALLDDEQYEKAITHLRKATILAPQDYHSWHNLGIAYMKLTRFKEAEECFLKEITLNSDNADPYRALVYLALVQKNPQQAKIFAQKTLTQWKEDPYLWRMLGIAAYQLKDDELAKQAFLRSFTLLPDPIIKYYRFQFENNLPITIQEL